MVTLSRRDIMKTGGGCSQRGWRSRHPLAISAGLLTCAMLIIAAAVTRSTDAGPIVRTVSLGTVVGFFGPTLTLDTVGGRAYVASDNGQRIAVFDTRTGALAQMLRVRTPPGSAVPQFMAPWVAVDPRTQHLFVLVGAARPWAQPATPELRVYMLDAMSGRILRSMPVGPAPGSYSIDGGSSPLTVDARDGRLFVSHFDATRVSMFDTRTGRLLRTIPIGHAAHVGNAAITVVAVTIDEHIHRVFVSDDASGTVTTLDSRTGQVLRAMFVGLHPVPPLIDIRRGRVTTLSFDRVTVLDAATGRPLTILRGDPRVGYGRAVDERTGTVVTVDIPGQPIRFRDSGDGHLLRRVPIPGNHLSVAVDADSGHILVLDQGPFVTQPTPNGTSVLWTGRDYLRTLDGHSGAALRSVAVGTGFGQVLVDEHANRAIVFTMGGLVSGVVDAWSWVPSGIRCLLPFIPRPSTELHSVPQTITFVDTSYL